MHYDLPVTRILQRELLVCSPDTTLAVAASRMHEARCGSILVVDPALPEQVLGIWTEKDALALDFNDPHALERPVIEVMSTPVKTLPDHASLGEAAVRFKQDRIRHLLVVDGSGRAQGVVSQTDVVNNQGIEFYVHLRNVESVVKSLPLQVEAETPMAEVVQRMREARCDAAIVCAKGVKGILTGQDVLRLISQGTLATTAGRVASFPLIIVPRDATLYQARQLFAERRIRHLGVAGDDGDIVGLLSYADILDSVEQEYVRELQAALADQALRLQKSEQALALASKVAETSLEAIMITDHRQIIRSVNPAFTLITGYTAEEAIGRDTRLLKSGLHDRAFYEAMYERITESGEWRGEIMNRRKNGEIYPEAMTITAVRNAAGIISNYVCVFSDISEQRRSESDLAESRQQLEQQSNLTESILDTLPLMVTVRDEAGRFVVVNELAASVLGKGKPDLVGCPDEEVLPAETIKRLREDDLKAVQSGKVVVREERLALDTDNPRHYLSYRRAIRLGRRQLTIAASVDITERKHAETMLAVERQVLRLIAEDAPLQRTLELLSGKVEKAVPRARAMVLLRGGPAREDGGVPMSLGAAPSLPAWFRETLTSSVLFARDATCGPALHFGVQHLCDDVRLDPRFSPSRERLDRLGVLSVWSTPIMSPGRDSLGVFTLFLDDCRRPTPLEQETLDHACKMAAIAIERSRASAELQRLATTDTLTGLANRSRFLDTAGEEWARSRRFGHALGVLMIDVDHFKRINDTHGHAAGDAALRHIAACLGTGIREVDRLGRMGGEEFAMVLPETDGVGAMQVAERLRQTVAAEPFMLADGVPLRLTVSIGVTVRVERDDVLDRLFARADEALYEAKRNGRNQAVFNNGALN
ncbi:hypothetical protein OTERR_19640 [Oryzomicrobium terrae]|uniref:Diguanylate cyclase n=2 Tax=Oryzomicrobium terrae TaxID=1735038 RepID=A0A5C1E980_9RHOO|nr:hypothetical protein OTERR_19640 [Oryzomicrobium terrae]